MRRAQNEFELEIKILRSDNGTKFKNIGVEEFLSEEGIKHEFSVPYTPQQNGVVERKNRTLIEAARTVLDEYKTLDNFWEEAINTACHAINRLYLHKIYKLITLGFLVVNALFLTRKSRAQSLLLEWTRVFCLAMHQMRMDIVFSIMPLVLLK
jgi:transposase InsO family protein